MYIPPEETLMTLEKVFFFKRGKRFWVKTKGERRSSLTQTIDLGPTLLEFFGIEKPKNMQGYSLKPVIEADQNIREVGIFGIFGGHVNITDGRYVYMRAPNEENSPLFHYTHFPQHGNQLFGFEEMQKMEWHKGFNFTKDCPVMKIPSVSNWVFNDLTTKLFDLHEDPNQKNPIKDVCIENNLIEKMISMMQTTDAPEEQYERLGFSF